MGLMGGASKHGLRIKPEGVASSCSEPTFMTFLGRASVELFY
jgi:hypothetical protein